MSKEDFQKDRYVSAEQVEQEQKKAISEFFQSAQDRKEQQEFPPIEERIRQLEKQMEELRPKPLCRLWFPENPYTIPPRLDRYRWTVTCEVR